MAISILLAQNSPPGGSGAFVFGGALFLVFMALVLLATAFWIWMLIDVLSSPLPTGEKVLWFLVIFFLHLLGALIYFVVRRSGRASPSL